MNNIESIFKEKSKELKINPSESAWVRLESRLASKPSTHLKLRYWLIAASITGLIFITGQLVLESKKSSISGQAETISLDFSHMDYGDAVLKINTLHDAYVKLGNKY